MINHDPAVEVAIDLRTETEIGSLSLSNRSYIERSETKLAEEISQRERSKMRFDLAEEPSHHADDHHRHVAALGDEMRRAVTRDDMMR